ncbi:unnamed protein product [Rotaria sordida]|uniref:Uncharacterized protein n=1 Tax=Rotaria sordida TaxID=392033 RepID=A0A815RA83_9BILA|nr:unnamed protein product [Rotaria sordida]CAF1135245.1 unnamed protein product [Rotaria sordida]CAF1201393.1 unnamed protein product [Rotaria sordida]CAF1290071.1 unnamed protein product [Rotaria sordida]CAF1474275.1 unnamed protein product [Rotaria sordida]
MSKQQNHKARTIEYWAGKKLQNTSSDLFLDRPRPGNTLFSGPNALCIQQYPIRDLIGDIGEGQASTLRSLDLGYLTRGYTIDAPLRRCAYPGEIGWTVTYFHRSLKPTKSNIIWKN